jgi:cation transport regulator ChaB
MPYDDISALPDPVKARYSPRCQEVFRKAFNNAASATTGGGAASDEAAMKIAHTAAGNCKSAGKAAEIKAEPMSTGQLDRWLAGKMPRRVLVVPFGGPIPSAKSSLGVDVDGEWFDRDTDLFGPFPLLRQTRDRIVDWHHDGDPTGRMKGAQLGHVVLDEEPESDGLWADFWARAGERRLALVRLLEERGARLFGSSEAKAGFVKKTDGHIDVWPLIRHTISTSPQNTLAVVPPLKAVLDHPDLADQPAGRSVRSSSGSPTSMRTFVRPCRVRPAMTRRRRAGSCQVPIRKRSRPPSRRSTRATSACARSSRG